ncbi:2OG-Fe(II) oxygenase [Sulfobacillus thermotolerans]|uniref:2OG-Fe(II) oxygenase n=1 Tax=Sulfobacillus thermotolerans TaxID=338644 RepID=UPI003D3017C0
MALIVAVPHFIRFFCHHNLVNKTRIGLFPTRPPRNIKPCQIMLNIGDVVVLCTASRPRYGHGPRSGEFYHGVAKVTSGERYSLSCLFHDE